MNTFEQSLLTELREHVASRGPTPYRRRPRRLAWLAAPVAVGATALAVGLVGVPGTDVGRPDSAAAAYTVSRSDGDVVLTITRLEDADGLEDALAAAGIDAEVEYGGREERLAGVEIYPLGGFVPEPPRAGETPLPASGKKPQGEHKVSRPVPEKRGGTRPAAPVAPWNDGLEVAAHGNSVTIRIPRSAIPDGRVLHIVASGALDLGLASFGVGWEPKS